MKKTIRYADILLVGATIVEKADDANNIIKDINVKLGNENATTELSTWEKIGEATGKLLSKANDVIVIVIASLS